MVTKAVSRAKSKVGRAKTVKARPIEDALQEFRNITETRYKIAKSTYENQDDLTKEVIDRIRDRLRIAATGTVNINGQPHKLEQQYVDFNIWFIACEILSDLAINGLQIANFVPDPAFCVECKKRILGVKEPKRNRRRG